MDYRTVILMGLISLSAFQGTPVLAAEIPQTSGSVTLSGNSLAVVKNVLSPTANLAEQLASLPPTSAGISTSGYTVQLGAFADAVAMQDFADNHGLRDLDNLLGHRVMVKGKVWYVITWGTFASPEKAETAWLAQQDTYAHVDYWVRSMESLNKARMQSKDRKAEHLVQ